MSSATVKNIDVEGVVLPNKPLTNFELLDAAKKLNIPNFRGVFLRDELPKKPRRNECGILNLDDSNGEGHTGQIFQRTVRIKYISTATVYLLLPNC